MTLEQFLSLVATIFGAVGSIYVLRSILKLTPQVTERISASVFGHNPEIIDSLSTQKAESIVGTYLILIALIIAVINSATTPSSIIVHPNRVLAIVIGVVLSLVVYLLLLFVGSRVNSIIVLQPRELLQQIPWSGCSRVKTCLFMKSNRFVI